MEKTPLIRCHPNKPACNGCKKLLRLLNNAAEGKVKRKERNKTSLTGNTSIEAQVNTGEKEPLILHITKLAVSFKRGEKTESGDHGKSAEPRDCFFLSSV